MTKPIVGIDLGTTNSLVAVEIAGERHLIPNALGALSTPSVVSLDGNDILVGQAACDRLVTHPHLTAAEFKRFMGTQKYFQLGRQSLTAEGLSSLVLRALKRDAEHMLGASVDTAVISVPAYFNHHQREATCRAARMADLSVARLINEPTAAALAYGLQKDDDSTYVIVDLGGGTLDISILECTGNIFEVHASAGDNYLGGLNFTQVLVDDFYRRAALRAEEVAGEDRARIQKCMEQAKYRLCTGVDTAIELELTGKNVEYLLSRAHFEKISEALMQRLRQPLMRALADAGLSVQEVDGVVLVGGASRMPMVRNLVGRMFRAIPMSHFNPETAIAEGAAIQAKLKAAGTAVNDIIITDVCSHTLGVEVANSETGRSEYLPIIERNTTVPVSVTRSVSSRHPDQKQVEVKVYQGECFEPRDNLLLGTVNVELPGRGCLEEVLLTYTFDVNGVLEVEIEIVSTQARQKAYFQGDMAGVSESELARQFDALQALKILPRDMQENKTLLARLDLLYMEAAGDLRRQIGQMLGHFKMILESHDREKIAQARVRIEADIQSSSK